MDKGLKGFYLNNKFALWPIISVVAIILMMVFIIVPQALSYPKISQQITEKQAKIQVLNDKSQKLENLDLNKLEQDLKVVLTVLPVSEDVPSALSVIQNMMSKVGLNLESSSYAAPQRASSGQNTSTIRLIAVGPVTSVKDFLDNLDNAPRLFQLESINLAFHKEDSGVDVEMPLSVFSSPQPQSIGTVDSPLPELSDKEKELVMKFQKSIEDMASSGSAAINSDAVPLGKADPFE